MNHLIKRAFLLALIWFTSTGQAVETNAVPGTTNPPPRYWSVALADTIITRNPGTDGGQSFIRNARRLDNGHYLVAHFGADVVREYDVAGKIVFEIPAPAGPHRTERLANGHTLVSTDEHPSGPRFFETDTAGKTIWALREDDLPCVSLKFLDGFQRQPNGDAVLANWLGHGQFGQAPQLIEITPEKRVVWKFTVHETMNTISNFQSLDDKALGL